MSWILGRRRKFTAGPEDQDAEKAAATEKWNAKHGKKERGDDEDEDDSDDSYEDDRAAGAAAARSKPVKLDQYVFSTPAAHTCHK